MQGNCLAAIPSFSLAKLDFDTLQPTPVLIATPPLSQTQISVIVPVRNEADTLPKTLLALANQVDFEDNPLDFKRYEVLVFANNCTDDSAAIARRFAQQHPQLQLHVVEQTLPEAEAHIGRVRQMLMDEAYRRLKLLGPQAGHHCLNRRRQPGRSPLDCCHPLRNRLRSRCRGRAHRHRPGRTGAP